MIITHEKKQANWGQTLVFINVDDCVDVHATGKENVPDAVLRYINDVNDSLTRNLPGVETMDIHSVYGYGSWNSSKMVGVVDKLLGMGIHTVQTMSTFDGKHKSNTTDVQMASDIVQTANRRLAQTVVVVTDRPSMVGALAHVRLSGVRVVCTVPESDDPDWAVLSRHVDAVVPVTGMRMGGFMPPPPDWRDGAVELILDSLGEHSGEFEVDGESWDFNVDISVLDAQTKAAKYATVIRAVAHVLDHDGELASIRQAAADPHTGLDQQLLLEVLRDFDDQYHHSKANCGSDLAFLGHALHGTPYELRAQSTILTHDARVYLSSSPLRGKVRVGDSPEPPNLHSLDSYKAALRSGRIQFLVPPRNHRKEVAEAMVSALGGIREHGTLDDLIYKIRPEAPGVNLTTIKNMIHTMAHARILEPDREQPSVMLSNWRLEEGSTAESIMDAVDHSYKAKIEAAIGEEVDEEVFWNFMDSSSES